MNDDAASLLRQWWSALPAMFPWLHAPNEAGAPDGALSTGGADVFSFDQLLTHLFDSWQPLLRSGGLATDGLWSMASQIEGGLSQLREALVASQATPASLGWPLPLQSMTWQAWSAPLLFAAGKDAGSATSNPLQIGADRTFGAFADAFGLRPMREAQEAWVALSEAESERRVAQASYLAIAAKVWGDGTRSLIARLEQMHRAGEQVTTFLAFVRLWAREADAALHAAMQSEQGIAAAARAVRASTRQREALQRLVALTSHALNVPTRAEVDDAYREIQELKRELRRLKKSAPRAGVKAQARAGKAGTTRPRKARVRP
jgi:HPt (histidine-containing phosphotransfer) domain-containing protein